MSDHSDKILPVPTPETEPYWAGCKEHELRLQCCDDCGRYQFYPRILCSHCAGDRLQWKTASGLGEIRSFTVVQRAVSAAYKPEVPYIVALVRLQEGPTMMSNVVQCEPGEVKVGMPVTVLFEDWSEQVSMPKFRPRAEGDQP